MYADFEFYTQEYKGNKIKSSDFPRLSLRASEDLDYMTPNHELEELLDFDGDVPQYLKNISVKIKKAVCALAEIEYDKEQFDSMAGLDNDGKGRAITQESRGTVSVSYQRQLSSTQNALEDIEMFEKLKLTTALRYLQGTSLMYRGIR